MRDIEFNLAALEHEMNKILSAIDEMKTRRSPVNMEEVRSGLHLLKTKYSSSYRLSEELPPLRRSISPLFFETREPQNQEDNECRSPISKPGRREELLSPYSPIVLK